MLTTQGQGCFYRASSELFVYNCSEKVMAAVERYMIIQSSSPFALPGKRSPFASLFICLLSLLLRMEVRAKDSSKYREESRPLSLSNNGRRKGNEITNSASKLATDRVRARTTASQARRFASEEAKYVDEESLEGGERE